MKIKTLLFGLISASLILGACQAAPNPSLTEPVEVDPTEADEVAVESPANDEQDSDEDIELPTSPPISGGRPPARAESQFMTDFSIHSVSYDEILAGGPPKDGIPPIDDPVFITIEEADTWLAPVEPVVQVISNQEAKAYPLQILTWHEIVNDTVGGEPVVVTFCPLCNTAIAFARNVDGQVLDFGTTGFLRYSNLIMYDRQTESWWQQATGESIVGSLTGTQLDFLPAALISWDEFKTTNPEGLVLSRETGFNRSYGRNPYVGYDDINNLPFLYTGPQTPDQLLPVARVLTLDFDGEAVAYPYDVLSEVMVVNDRVGREDVAIFWTPGTASALDTPSIPDGKDVGSALAYSRVLGDQLLSFQFDGQNIVDEPTGSVWNIHGRAVDGPLTGEQLTEVVSVNHLWFSWAAFRPETRVYQVDD